MRYRQDVLRDIQLQEARIASNRKTADLTSSRKTAAICDAVYPSMLRRLADLGNELERAPVRPPRQDGFRLPDGCSAAPQGILTRVTPLSDEELAGLEIPIFLRRVA